MALLAAGRNVVGAGFTLIGITVWVVAAIGVTAPALRWHSSGLHSAGS